MVVAELAGNHHSGNTHHHHSQPRRHHHHPHYVGVVVGGKPPPAKPYRPSQQQTTSPGSNAHSNRPCLSHVNIIKTKQARTPPSRVASVEEGRSTTPTHPAEGVLPMVKCQSMPLPPLPVTTPWSVSVSIHSIGTAANCIQLSTNFLLFPFRFPCCPFPLSLSKLLSVN